MNFIRAFSIFSFLMIQSIAFGAIQKNIETPSGFTANYVYLTDIEMSLVGNECLKVTFGVWKDKAAFDAGMVPAVQIIAQREWCGEENPLRRASIDAIAATVTNGDYYGPIYGLAYVKALAEIPEFEGGTLIE